MTFEAKDEPQVIWTSGDVKVSAIRSTHIAGHASYRGYSCRKRGGVGGDAGNDKTDPPRSSSTSEQVEKLAHGADVIVHSAIHPVLGPDSASGFPPLLFNRQSAASDTRSDGQACGGEISDAHPHDPAIQRDVRVPGKFRAAH